MSVYTAITRGSGGGEPRRYRAVQPRSIRNGRASAGPEQECRRLGNLRRLDEALHRLRREDHVFDHALLRHAVRLRLVGDLRASTSGVRT
jgi:hypothetical protein